MPFENEHDPGAAESTKAHPIEDLAAVIGEDDANQVKGGFDPQPDPPRLLDPIQISTRFIKQ
jgi:hypothetical protein